MALREACRVLLVALLLALGSGSTESVITLDSDNFDDVVGSSDFLVTAFIAPWCGHCKKLLPEWEKAAGILKNDDPPIRLAKVDATDEKNKELAKRFQIRGYPTIKIFRKGEGEQDYKGPRDTDGIVRYVRKQAAPPSRRLTTQQEALDMRNETLAVFGCFSDETSQAFQTFNKVASAMRDEAEFGHSHECSLLREVLGDGKVGDVALSKNFDTDKGVARLSGTTDEGELKEFIRQKSIPFVIRMDSKDSSRLALRKMFEENTPKAIGFAEFFDENSLGESLVNTLYSAGQKYEGTMRFIVADPSANEGVMKHFDITRDQLPAIAIYDGVNDKKYVNTLIEPSHVQSWLEEYFAGKLKPTIKSEEPPQQNTGPVLDVVANEFSEYVHNGKDTFIMLYSPSCPHCKKSMPILDEVGERFKEDAEVQICRMDVTKNDVPSSDMKFKGVPAFFFVNGKTQEVMSYSGDRSTTSIVDFINHRRASATSPDSGASASEHGTTFDEL